jgi:hypothetical protein
MSAACCALGRVPVTFVRVIAPSKQSASAPAQVAIAVSIASRYAGAMPGCAWTATVRSAWSQV